MTIEEVNRALKSIDTDKLYTTSDELLVYKSVVNAVIAATEKGDSYGSRYM